MAAPTYGSKAGRTDAANRHVPGATRGLAAAQGPAKEDLRGAASADVVHNRVLFLAATASAAARKVGGFTVGRPGRTTGICSGRTTKDVPVGINAAPVAGDARTTAGPAFAGAINVSAGEAAAPYEGGICPTACGVNACGAQTDAVSAKATAAGAGITTRGTPGVTGTTTGARFSVSVATVFALAKATPGRRCSTSRALASVIEGKGNRASSAATSNEASESDVPDPGIVCHSPATGTSVDAATVTRSVSTQTTTSPMAQGGAKRASRVLRRAGTTTRTVSTLAYALDAGGAALGRRFTGTTGKLIDRL